MRRLVTLSILLLLALFGTTFAEKIQVAPTQTDVDVYVDQSSTSKTVVRFEVGAFEKTPVEVNGDTYYNISINREGRRLFAGEPQLPTLSRSIIIPNDARMTVKVLDMEYVDIPNTPVMPSKGGFDRSIDPDDVPYTFGPVYNSADWFPSELAGLRKPFILRDYRGTTIDVAAFQYNAATRTLRVYTSVTVEVTVDGVSDENVLTKAAGVTRLTPDFDLVYSERFINYRQTAQRDKYTEIMESGDLLIITHDAFHDAMLPFVEWKEQKGIKTTMVDVSTIGNTVSAITAYISSFYNNPSNNLAFVLLVGDYAQVTSPQASGGASDPTYVQILGSDDYPDLLIGRFSAETVAHVETQVERSIEYERDMTAGDWLHKGIGIGSSEGSSQGHNGEADYVHIGKIRDSLLNFTYTQVDELYATNGATAAQVAASCNDGRSVINYCGHGSTTTWVTTGFSNSNVDALTNSNMLPFIISVACVNGEFDGQTCFAEAWMRNTNNTTGEPTGAIATFMSSINQDWVPPMDGQDEVNHLLVQQMKTSFGGLCFNGTCKMVELDAGGDGATNGDTWHVFGDPSVQVRTAVPAVLSVSHEPIMLFTSTEFEVQVAGVEGALCALYHEATGTPYGVALTDASGAAVITLTAQPPVGEVLVLTVTSFNTATHVGAVQVIAPSGPYVVFDSVYVNDAAGNGNHEVDFGETILLGVQLQNVGPDDAVEVNATLTTADPYVTITDGAEAYGTVAANFGVVYIADAFGLEVAGTVPDGHLIELALAVTGTARDTWYGTIRLTAHAPAVEYVSFAIDDASGNDNGILDPGETADVLVTLSNTGSGQVDAVSAYLTETDLFVAVDDDYSLFGTIAGGGTATNGSDVYTVTADADCPMGHAVGIALGVTGANGYAATLNFSLTVGDRVVFFYDDFAFNQGWTGLGGAGEWTIGPAIGGGTTYKDPTADHTATPDNMVLGNDLTSAGTYNNNISGTDYVYSPVIDCSDKTGVQMRYWHWLGCESSTYDHAYFEVYDGEAWTRLSENTASNQATSWSESYYDLSAYADNNPGFRLRWGLGPTDGSGQYSGWNLDDLELKGYSGGGAPQLALVPESLSDSLQPGATGTHVLRIYNTGTSNLGIWFTSDSPWLQFTYEKLSVSPADSVDLQVQIVTAGLLGGDHTGSLNFNSNDNDQPTGSIPVSLYVYSPAVALPGLGEDSLISARVRPEETGSYDLTVVNNGPGTLLWTAGCLMDPSSKRVITPAVATVLEPMGYRVGDPEKQPGVSEPYYEAQTKGSGGPDTYGYTWVDSDEPGGPVYEWVDISTVGTVVPGLDDDNSVLLTLGFGFPFYDSVYTSLYLGSNGLIMFDTGYGTAANYALPTSSFKSALIALWHDDLDPPEAGEVYYYNDVANGRFIVSFDHIRNYLYPTGTGDLSFQALLYADGRIVLQYGTMDPGTDTDGLIGATIGLQNSTYDDGLTVVYNAAYMHDHLAIQISAASWLSVASASGEVAPYGTGTVPVLFDAAGLVEGEYTGTLTLGCNDPAHAVMTLPVVLAVGSGCCEGATVGNLDDDPLDAVTMGDLTVLIDALFISYLEPACLQEADIDLSGAPDPTIADVTMSDLTILIDNLFISYAPLLPCP